MPDPPILALHADRPIALPRARRSAAHRLPHLPRQPALRRPGRLQPPPRPRAHRARAHGDDVRGPAVAGRRRAGHAREGRRASTSTGARTRSGCRGRTSSATAIDLAGVRDHVQRPGFPEPYTFSRAGPQAARRPAAPTSTSSTTTSASAPGCSGCMRRRLAVRATRCTTRSPSTATSTSRTRRAPCRRLHAAPLVRVPRHADEGRAPAAAPRHGVGELEEGHRRPDGRRPRHAAHRAGRRRPGAVPSAAARRARARAG